MCVYTCCVCVRVCFCVNVIKTNDVYGKLLPGSRLAARRSQFWPGHATGRMRNEILFILCFL